MYYYALYAAVYRFSLGFCTYPIRTYISRKGVVPTRMHLLTRRVYTFTQYVVLHHNTYVYVTVHTGCRVQLTTSSICMGYTSTMLVLLFVYTVR